MISLQLGVKFESQNNYIVVDFSNTEQLNYNLQCNYLDFTQPLSCCSNFNR